MYGNGKRQQRERRMTDPSRRWVFPKLTIWDYKTDNNPSRKVSWNSIPLQISEADLKDKMFDRKFSFGCRS